MNRQVQMTNPQVQMDRQVQANMLKKIPLKGRCAIASGNIFDSGADMLVNPVNTVGVMGKGLAFQFRTNFRDYYFEYRDWFHDGLLQIGTVPIYEHGADPRYIASFPTKAHWKEPSLLQYIELGLEDLALRCLDLPGLKSLAIPALGCDADSAALLRSAGEGGLSWDDVRPLIESTFEGLPFDVLLYPPR